MTIDSFETIFYTCIFLLPGFIIKSIIDTLVPPVKYNDSKYFFSYLLYSILNCAVCSWLYLLILPISKNRYILYWVLLVLITIASSIAIALLIGVIKQQEFIEKTLSKLKINKIHPIPTAWDYYFSKQEASWIIVTLKNGRIIYGNFSENSFASSDTEERDLYIEKTYIVDDNMSWIEDKSSKGILISKEEIETIEFLITNKEEHK